MVCPRCRSVVHLRFQWMAYIRSHRENTPPMHRIIYLLSREVSLEFSVMMASGHAGPWGNSFSVEMIFASHRLNLTFRISQTNFFFPACPSGVHVICFRFSCILGWRGNHRSPVLTCFQTRDRCFSAHFFAFEVCSGGVFDCGSDASRRDYSLCGAERFQFSHVFRVVRLIFDFWGSL